MKIAAFVPIKLNSARLPSKNILPFGAHPLCWHMVHKLLQIKQINSVYVYCSDEKIQNYIPSDAIFLKRDTSLDGDLTKGMSIYENFVENVDADLYVLAHTTSPLIKTESILNALNQVTEKKFDSAFSAKKIQTFAWYEGKPINYTLNDIPRTQDIKPIYVETSAFYIFSKDLIKNHRRRIGFHPYIQVVDEIEGIDIDEKEDYDFALKMLKYETDIDGDEK